MPARNVVLLGDPLQFAQVSQATPPEGTGASVLETFPFVLGRTWGLRAPDSAVVSRGSVVYLQRQPRD